MKEGGGTESSVIYKGKIRKFELKEEVYVFDCIRHLLLSRKR